MFVVAIIFFSCNVLNANPLKCVLTNNQKCRILPEMISVNSNKPLFYPYSIKVNKCSGRCNNINDLFAKLCVPDIVKNINIKVLNLIPRTNEARYID